VKPTRTTESNRIRSALATFIGFGYAIYLAVSIVEFGRDSDVLDCWYTPIAVPLAFAPGLLLLVCALFASIQTTRAAAALSAVS
jgi:hypothetical protein